MPIQNATATLVSTTSAIAITGFVDLRQGFIDTNTNSIKPLTVSSWRNLGGSTWSNYNSYLQNPLPIIWTSDQQDLGEVLYFNLQVLTETVGSVESYTIYTSETGLFQGEESITIAENGDFDIPGFYGRYFYVQVKALATEIISMDISTSTATTTVKFNDLNTSTLSGTSSQRTLSLTYAVSKILDMDIKCKAATSYAVNLYVSDTATSKVVIPIVLDKTSTAPKFALVGIDNDYRDAVVDITLTCLPRQIMGGGSLYTVS